MVETTAAERLLEAEVVKLRAVVAEMTAAIGFETTCLNCASILEASYEQTCRAERAEAELERMRPGGATKQDVQPVEAD